MQVAKTLSCPGICPLPLFVALCDNNPQIWDGTDRQTDGRTDVMPVA